MSAVDVGARGLAVRALAQSSAADEGVVNLDARNSESALDTETLMDSAGAVSGHAGAVHRVTEIPYPKRVVIRGNGAELRNINATELSENLLPSVGLALGFSNVFDTPSFNYVPVEAANGPELTVAAGAGANFSPGDLVILHGSSHYATTGQEYDYEVFRNYLRASVVASTADTITLDRDLPEELLADEPVIANASSTPWGEGAYLLHRPHISHFTISSEKGHALFWGGVIDGTFRDIHVDGRNAISFNAMQDCLFENIHFRAWRKICELAEGSLGTRVRGLTGTLSDASAKFGGQSDVPGSFISMNENCAECVFEDMRVSSGSNDAPAGNGCQIRPGRNNVIRNSILRFPAHTGTGLALVSNAEAGHSNQDCGFEGLQVFLPACSTFFQVADQGAGVVRPFFRNVKFFGSASVRAGLITGEGGLLDNVWCEDGALRFSDPCTNWRIENCYFPDGFENLTRALLHTNAIRNNESDASRRIAAAAIVDTSQSTIQSNTPNSVAHTMTIAPGDLALLDEVHLRIAGRTAGGGTNTRHVRVTCMIGGANPVEVAHMTVSENGASYAVEGTVEVQSNAVVHASMRSSANNASTLRDSRITGGNLAANGLVLEVEIWTDTSGAISTQLVKIAGQKAGMRNVPVFG